MVDCVQIVIDMRNVYTQELRINIKFEPTSLLQEFSIPCWTPGSYKIRDHVQYIYDLKVEQSTNKISLKREETNIWKAELNSLEVVNISYIVEASDLTVRTSYIDDKFAAICLSTISLLITEKRDVNHKLDLLLPKQWESFIPLEFIDQSYFADNYDQLVDAPLMAGIFKMQNFKVLKKNHQLLCIGEPTKGWPENFINDIERICYAACSIFQESPPASNNYVFIIQMFDKGYGGLEHDNSCVIQFNWKTLYSPEGYRKLLQIIGHEYFHQWNVRRLRPREYLSYDYNKAVISDSLWFAEGVTSYYDLSLPMIAGLSSSDEFLNDLAVDISHVLSIPGREIHTLADSSREAWVKLYNSRLASTNTQISYYRFGTILALYLDLELRHVGSSLSTVLRLLWNKFGKTRLGYLRDDIKVAIATFDIDLAEELDFLLDQTKPINLEKTFQYVGIDLIQSQKDILYSGITYSKSSIYPLVECVEKNSPAYFSEIIEGDEIVAINKFKISSVNDIDQILQTNTEASILYFRHGKIHSTNLIPITIKEKKWNLRIKSQSTDKQLKLRKQWL